jgi:magnesium-transporting ATPase (P-type)
MGKYLRFGLMLLVSFIAMYAIMFFNAAEADHVMLSTMRTYMSLLMVFSMAIIMLLFMLHMYDNKKMNAIILTVAIVGFGTVYYFVRNQTFVGDIDYMKGMIPHHSSAILTSQQAHLEDPEVKQLAEEIIEAQKREIAQMKKMIYRLEQENN